MFTPDLNCYDATDYDVNQEIVTRPEKKRKRAKPIERDNAKYLSKSGASVASPDAPGRPSIIVNLWGAGRIGVFIKRGRVAAGEPAPEGSPLTNFVEMGVGYIQRISPSMLIDGPDTNYAIQPMHKPLSAIKAILKPRLKTDIRSWATACGIWNSQVDRIPKNILAVVNTVTPGTVGQKMSRNVRLKLLGLLRDLPEEAIAQAKKNKQLIWRLFKIMDYELLTRAEIKHAFTAAAMGRVAAAVKAATPFLTKKERAILSNCLSTGQGFSPENPIRAARDVHIADASHGGIGLLGVRLASLVEFAAETVRVSQMLDAAQGPEPQWAIIANADKPIRPVESIDISASSLIRAALSAEMPRRAVRSCLRNILRLGKISLREDFRRWNTANTPAILRTTFAALLGDVTTMLGYGRQMGDAQKLDTCRLVTILQADRPTQALQAIHDEFAQRRPRAAQPRAGADVRLGPFKLSLSERNCVTCFQNPFMFLPAERFEDAGIDSVHFLNSIDALHKEAEKQSHCVWSYGNACRSLLSLIMSVEMAGRWYTCELSVTTVDRELVTHQLYGYRGVLDVAELLETEIPVTLQLVQVEGAKIETQEGGLKRNVITGPRCERIRGAFEQVPFYLADPRTLPWYDVESDQTTLSPVLIDLPMPVAQ